MTEAGSPVSLVWAGEAEAVGGCMVEAEPQRHEGAGGEGEAWILRCCEVGRA